MGLKDKYVAAYIEWFRKEREKFLSLLIDGLIFIVLLPIIITFSGILRI